MTVHFTFNSLTGKDKVTFRLAGWDAASPASTLIPDAIDLVFSAASSMVVVDRGHRHSDGSTEVSFWLHRPASNGGGCQATEAQDSPLPVSGHIDAVHCPHFAGPSLRADAPEFRPHVQSSVNVTEGITTQDQRYNDIDFLLAQPAIEYKWYSFRHDWSSLSSADGGPDLDGGSSGSAPSGMPLEKKSKRSRNKRKRKHNSVSKESFDVASVASSDAFFASDELDTNFLASHDPPSTRALEDSAADSYLARLRASSRPTGASSSTGFSAADLITQYIASQSQPT
jgi:hypothetical protein